MEIDEAPKPPPWRPGFSVAHQKVEIEVNFNQQCVGRTEITIHPESADLSVIRLHSRQCRIDKITINNLSPASISHSDPCDQLCLHGQTTVHQHHILASKIEKSTSSEPGPELAISLPKNLKIEKVDITEVQTQTHGIIKITNPENDAVDAEEVTQSLTDATVAKFTPLTVVIDFSSTRVREAVHFVIGKRKNGKWPHAYTRGKIGPGYVSHLFPCVDSIRTRCTWDISITCPRTVGDALDQSLSLDFEDRIGIDDNVRKTSDGIANQEMIVVCSGELTDDMVYKHDSTKKIVSFSCSQQLSAQQIGFAIGPFEQVNLADLRDAREVEELGRNAVELFAYCLPGRAEETKNTCLPTAKAMDFIVRKYIACPVRSYATCFVEEMANPTSVFAGVTMASTQNLYPEDIIDQAQPVTRHLVHAIVSQWIGINIVAEESRDTWAVVGCAHYLTELFMRELCGNNEFRYRMKQQSDLVLNLDHNRPSIYDLGELLHVDPSEYDFLVTKAPVVLFILDRRIAKVAGVSKMPAIIAKICTRARLGELAGNFLSTDTFQRTCERFYHAKIDDFIGQWVKGAGCPRFQAFQRFNKKKMVVEMLIKQVQGTSSAERDLDVDFFMRDVREEFQSVYAANPQPVFTGPMTIRIHEADGTPYEHIVEIKDASTTFDIPYSTKYKRLKRTKRQKAKASKVAEAGGGDDENDALVYCLGDVLQGEDEILNWRITEWSPEDEERMNSESYEWIRLDADFEWIARINLQMPGYMFTSQLQQDRDVVAQLEAIRHISNYPASPLISSIFIRTLMDRRYFHGVRSTAARSLVKHALDEGEAGSVGLYHLKKAFEELYCLNDQGAHIQRPNNFSDQLAYILQCEIIEALAQVRDSKGHAPREVKDFLLDKLKFNDNSINQFSDAFYVTKLMRALCQAVTSRPQTQPDANDMDMDMEEEIYKTRQLELECIAEIDRYRRMDEWTSSYQNLYSRSALQSQATLAEAGIGIFSPLHFLQYTREGNYDRLRKVAFEILVQPRILENESLLRYTLHCMVADSSPFIRRGIQHAFGRILAKKAIGIDTSDARPIAEGLVIEDIALDDRQKEMARKKTVEGAMSALKNELGPHEPLRSSLWAAVNHPDIALEDLQPLLDFCRLLYDPVDQYKVALRLPRYWRMQNLGKGKLHFEQTSKVRTKTVSKWVPPVAPKLEQKTGTGLKLTFKKNQPKVSKANPTLPPTPIVQNPAPPAPAIPGRVVLKLKAPKI